MNRSILPLVFALSCVQFAPISSQAQGLPGSSPSCGIGTVSKGVGVNRAVPGEAVVVQERGARVDSQQIEANERSTPARALALPPIDAPNGLPDVSPSSERSASSEWIESEEALYEELVSHGSFGTLVVPFQVCGLGFDRATRALMTAELAVALQGSEKGKVPDPFLVAKALGDGQRNFRPEAVYRLANVTGAKQIVAGFVGHNANGMLSVTIVAQTRPSGPQSSVWRSPISIKRFDGVAFSDEAPAIEAYESLLPQIQGFLNLSPVGIAHPIASNVHEGPDLPASPAVLVRSEHDPIQDAYAFQLLAALTPKYMDATREHFAVKAYLASLQVAKSASSYAAVHARALKALGLRPAALAILRAPRTNEEEELVAALNGNLPEITRLASQERNLFKRLIEKLDESGARDDYGVKGKQWVSDTVKGLKLSPQWSLLATRAFRDGDGRLRDDNAWLVPQLDAAFSIKGFGGDDLKSVRGEVSDSTAEEVKIALALEAYRKRVVERNVRPECCSGAWWRPGALDFVDLEEAIGRDNLIRRLRLAGDAEVKPNDVMVLARALEAVYRGEPYYTLLRSRVEEALAAAGSGADASEWSKVAKEHAEDARLWEQGQSHVSSEAFDALGGANFYASDLPMHPYYAPFSGIVGSNSEPFARAALRNASTQFRAVLNVVWHFPPGPARDPLMAALQREIAGRFIGCPMRGELLASDALRRGEASSAITILRDSIRASPDYWHTYVKLATILLQDGQPDDAARVLISYPGFQSNTKVNGASLSDYRIEGGAMFYWSGRFDLAKQLYGASPGAVATSESEMARVARLDMIAGRLDLARPALLEWAQRYRSPYAYRDYLSILHASGRSGEAWSTFDALANELKNTALWESVLVGHRRAGITEQQAIDWAKRDDWKGLDDVRGFAALYLARFGTTDRTPSLGLAEAVNALDPASWKVDDAAGRVLRSSHDPNLYWVVAPVSSDAPGLGSLPACVVDGLHKHRIRSDLSYFVEGYRYLKVGDFIRAKQILEEAATFYEPSAPDFGFLLPYLALAEVKAGDSVAIEKRLERISPLNRGFDYQLARAIVAAGAEKNKDALAALNLARYQRPHLGRRTDLTQYTFAEMAEELVRMTKDEAIRDLALDWVRSTHVFEPWHAWSYAIEAVLARDSDERGRAIAMAHFLDPHSERLSKFSLAEIETAAKTYASVNPFMIKEATSNRLGVESSAQPIARSEQPAADTEPSER